MIVFSIVYSVDHVLDSSTNCLYHKIEKYSSQNFQLPKATSSNCYFCLTNSPKSKNLSHYGLQQRKQHIFTFDELETVIFFYLK